MTNSNIDRPFYRWRMLNKKKLQECMILEIKIKGLPCISTFSHECLVLLRKYGHIILLYQKKQKWNLDRGILNPPRFFKFVKQSIMSLWRSSFKSSFSVVSESNFYLRQLFLSHSRMPERSVWMRTLCMCSNRRTLWWGY